MKLPKVDIAGVILAIIIVLVMVSLVKLGGMKVERDAAVQALEGLQQAQKRTENISATARAEKRSTALESASIQERLQKAQEANPDWASTVTPPEVQQALQGAIAGLE